MEPYPLREALQDAINALEEIALAGMSGTGQESDEAMTAWPARRAREFISAAARALEPAKAALTQSTSAAKVEPQPVAWAIFTESGNARMWSTLQPHVQKLADAEGLTVTPLYAAPRAQAQPLTDEQIDARVMAVEGAMPAHREVYRLVWRMAVGSNARLSGAR